MGWSWSHRDDLQREVSTYFFLFSFLFFSFFFKFFFFLQACAIFLSGLKCWGWNSIGQLGTEDATYYGSSPTFSISNAPYVLVRVQCSAGTWSSSGIAPCTPCGAGKYSAAVGAASDFTCNSCSPGTYSLAAVATSIASCLPCAPGFECPDPASAPVPCSLGSWSAGGVTACTDCPAGTFSNTANADSGFACSTCGPNSYSLPGTWHNYKIFRLLFPSFFRECNFNNNDDNQSINK
jgi:hypothetical protein